MRSWGPKGGDVTSSDIKKQQQRFRELVEAAAREFR